MQLEFSVMSTIAVIVACLCLRVELGEQCLGGCESEPGSFLFLDDLDRPEIPAFSR